MGSVTIDFMSFCTPTAAANRPRGFTLIELMVTVAIAAVLVALAAPSLQSFIIRNKFSSIGNEFSGSILRARNEAVSKNICTTMCMSDTVDAATPFCKQSDPDWQVGWIVFMNPNCDPDYGKDAGTNKINPTDMLVARRPANPDYFLMSQRNPPTRRIVFNPRGNIGLTNAGEFDLAYQSTGNQLTINYGFNICLNQMGRTISISSTSSCP